MLEERSGAPLPKDQQPACVRRRRAARATGPSSPRRLLPSGQTDSGARSSALAPGDPARGRKRPFIGGTQPPRLTPTRCAPAARHSCAEPAPPPAPAAAHTRPPRCPWHPAAPRCPCGRPCFCCCRCCCCCWRPVSRAAAGSAGGSGGGEPVPPGGEAAPSDDPRSPLAGRSAA